MLAAVLGLGVCWVVLDLCWLPLAGFGLFCSAGLGLVAVRRGLGGF